MAPAGNAARWHRPAKPFKDGRTVPAPSRDTPGTDTAPQPRGTPGWARKAVIIKRNVTFSVWERLL